jgi:cytochrome c peroxidase
MPVQDTYGRRFSTRGRRIALGATVGALASASLLALAGCGSSATPSSRRANTPSTPAYVTEPFTQEQRLVEQGARLVVSDGCAACHLIASARGIAPSFSSFAGHRVKLADGHSAVVDEAFVREGLLHPDANRLSGYDPAPMLAAVARLDLAAHTGQVAALAAFIEQVGPEPEQPSGQP